MGRAWSPSVWRAGVLVMKDNDRWEPMHERARGQGENAVKTLNATITAFVAMALFEDADDPPAANGDDPV